MVEQDGLWYHVNHDQFNSNRSDVIDHELPKNGVWPLLHYPDN